MGRLWHGGGQSLVGHFADAYLAIKARFDSTWTATPVQWPNIPFTEPVSQIWIAVHVLNGQSSQASVNTVALYRYVGSITVQVIVPKDKGEPQALAFIDQLEAHWRRKEFSTTSGGRIVTSTPWWNQGREVNGKYQIAYNVPFRRDQFLS